MDLAELVQLRDQVETALTGKIVIEREELQSKLAELGTLERRRTKRAGRAANGAKVSKVAAGGSKAKRHPLKGRKALPKYRGPDGQTWAGRGLAPKWLTALEKKGNKREQFLVAK
jgi:DNA-binding protein H-NS